MVTFTRTITVAAGVFAPGHLGELTQFAPFELVDDILAQTKRPGLFRVGFAAEAGPNLQRARAKKAAKAVDMLVFNDILAEGVGIGSDENEITIITAADEIHVPRTSKARCACAIADHIEAGLTAR